MPISIHLPEREHLWAKTRGVSTVLGNRSLYAPTIRTEKGSLIFPCLLSSNTQIYLGIIKILSQSFVDYVPNLLLGFRDHVVQTLRLPTCELKQNHSTDIRLRAALYWGRRCKITSTPIFRTLKEQRSLTGQQDGQPSRL